MLNNKGLKKLEGAIKGGNHALAQEVIGAIAFSINSHEDFRKLLETVEPEFRAIAYQDLRDRLSFTPKPLADYVSDAAADAERRQLPEWDSKTGQLTPFTPARSATLAEAAENALYAGGIGVMTCRRCTVEEIFKSDTPAGARIQAVQAGWSFEPAIEKWLCPNCSDAAKEN